MITIHLSIHPVAFARPRFNKGRGFNAPHYSLFKRDVIAMLKQKVKTPPLEVACEVVLLFNLERPKVKREEPCVRPDLDNYIKAILDCGNEILWKDDGLIVDIHAFKRYGDPGICIIYGKLGELNEKNATASYPFEVAGDC